MARLILDTNCFSYNNKYYQQTRGGAMGSAFTQVLANIYMYEWEQDLIKHQAIHNGVYGRYIDDNENGQLKTSLYYKLTTEPYILPYTSDHSRHIHRNMPYAALLCAARICSDVQDFNTECIRIDMFLLVNNYPPNFIKKQIYRFFQLNNAMPIVNELNDQVYHRLHQQLLSQPTQREKQLHLMTQDPI
ncbi:unnamed protein product [Rotaria sordida]|uniref:Helix-turn-helix domain-containing protein n=2 Tax=Rotaria sordida TaxID=392033 RepID=A0A815IX47_9BILA|nr:unnamed protein product [Rotaria sordida]CAF1613076.1 unnamed protein product [Rotaria sordida]